MFRKTLIALLLTTGVAHAGTFETSAITDSVDTAITALEAVYAGDITLTRADSDEDDVTISLSNIPAATAASLNSFDGTVEVEQKELTKSGSTFSFTKSDSYEIADKTTSEIEAELIIARGFVAQELYGNATYTVADVEPVKGTSYGKVGTMVNTLIDDIAYINNLAVEVALGGTTVNWQSFDPAATRAGNNLTKLNELVANIETAIESLTKK